jgi:predicted PurR-regulated permease PerM
MDKTTRQTLQWTKQQDRQYNGQNNKTRQYNGQNNKTDNTMDKTTRQDGLFCCFVHCMVCLVVLSIVWSVLLLCPLYGLSCCFVQQDRQYNGQNNKTDNAMDKTTRQRIQWTKQQDRQYNGQNNKTDNTMDKTTRHIVCLVVLSIVLSVLLFCPLHCLSCCFVHCIVCLVVLSIVLSVLLFCPLYSLQSNKTDHTMDKTTRQTIQWTKQQDRPYNGQNNKTDNTMDKTTRQTIQWTKQQDKHGLSSCFVHCIVCFVVLSIVWSVLLFCPLYGLFCCFVHCIICLVVLSKTDNTMDKTTRQTIQ